MEKYNHSKFPNRKESGFDKNEGKKNNVQPKLRVEGDGMHTIFLLAGGNLNNTTEKFEQLFSLFQERVGKILHRSSYHQSEAWGFKSEYPFINIALCLQTKLSTFELLRATQSIEKDLGRTSKTTTFYQDRTMDIDIIFYDNEIIKTDTLEIPHPKMHERDFVLTLLNEIAPNFIHPIFEVSVKELKTNIILR